MADTTTVMALPFPEGADANDVPADMQALAERLDEAPGIESLTSAEIAALAAGEKPAGRVVYNSTTSKLQVSNGTSFANIDAAALPKAGGTMSGAIAMGSNKVTGLASGTVSTDAVNKGQLDAVSTVASAALPKAGGTMSGAIAMGNNKVTGLAAGTASSDAVNKGQLGPVYVVGVRAGDQALSQGLSTTITYPSETDPDAMLSSGIITLTAGVWVVTGYAYCYGLTPAGDVYLVTTILHGSSTVASATGMWNDSVMSVSAVVVASASDTVKMTVFNSSSTGSQYCQTARLAAVKIGL